MLDTKQVVIIRKDLRMRRGKEGAQISHGSIAFLADKIKNKSVMHPDGSLSCLISLNPDEVVWFSNLFTKIVCQVNSENELLDIYNKAKDAKLTAYLITDSGKTELKEPTHTVVAIGPNSSEEIDKITKNLKLY